MSPRKKKTAEDEARDLQVRLLDLINSAMDEAGVTRAELARLMGISRATVTQTLRPDSNMMVGTAAKILFILGYRLNLDLEAI